MNPEPAIPGAGGRRSPLTLTFALILLALHAVLAAGSVREKSATVDELIHLTGGYSYWMKNDYRLHPENGNLPQRWAALPLAIQAAAFPGLDPGANAYETAHTFFYRLGNDADAMLFQGRMMTLALSLCLGLCVYLAAARVFGPLGGLISLGLYCFSPTILAHARLSTSDLAASLFFILAVGAIWRVLHRVTAGTLILAALAVSGLLLSKMSAVLIVPVALLMILVRALWGVRHPLIIGDDRQVLTRFGQAGAAAGAALVVGLFSIALIWGAYGFRFSAAPETGPGQRFSFPDWAGQVARTGRLEPAILFLRNHRVLPEAYLYGTAFVLSHSRARPAFLAGHHRQTGWWYFFPVCFAVKTPLTTLLVLALAGLALACRRRRGDGYALSPLLCFAAVYAAAAMASHINIGHRHILPLYPVLFILAGAAARWHAALPGRFRGLAALVAAALIIETQSIRPHYLAFFNAAAGGPQNGYRLLVDSSLDWGQDLPGLARWITARQSGKSHGTPVYLAYFGTASPAHHRVSARLIPVRAFPWALDEGNDWAYALKPGDYCISATELQQVYGLTPRWPGPYEDAYRAGSRLIDELQRGAGDPAVLAPLLAEPGGEQRLGRAVRQRRQTDFARLCAVLRQRPPDAAIGYSILIYRVSGRELDRALNGAPGD